MAVFPLLERDLSVALRKQRPVSRRLKVAAGGVAGTLLLLFFVNVLGDNEASQELHMILFLVGVIFALQAPRLVAEVIARERQEQTLGLLFLSGLGAGEIFLGKFFSAALIAFADLLAIYPMLAVPFLTGGISFDHFTATICWLPMFLFFLLAISLLASVLAEDGASALPLATGIGALICGLPLLIYFAQAQLPSGAPSDRWLLLSPVSGALLIFKRTSRVGTDFWQNFAITFAYSVSCLAIAAWRLSRIWRLESFGARRNKWTARWRNFYHGDAAWRRELGRRWLDVNAVVLLGLRDRKPAVLTWMTVTGFALVWLAVLAFWPSRSIIISFFMLSAAFLGFLLRWIIFYTAASGMAKGRLEGAYDLLLTTPITPGEIVWGQVEALNAQFKPVCRFVVGLECVLAAVGLTLRSWTVEALLVYSVAWALLIYWGWKQTSRARYAIPAMWAGLNGARPAHAAWKTLGVNMWAAAWFVACFRQAWSSLARFPSGSLVEFIVILSCGLLLFAFVLRPGGEIDTLESRLVEEFHEIVHEPIPEPTDPRFKNWNPQERFPWGGEIARHQRLERLHKKLGPDAN
jgi:ABC-type transport system involved in multi-copper enzyme maturation permease subunit